MWQRVSQRLADPVTYRKHWRRIVRLIRPPREAKPVAAGAVLSQAAERGFLVVIAHPDDEVFSSALIARATARGTSVHLACLTRGEGGPVGDATRETLGRVRERELRASATALGIRSVTFLGHVDPVGESHRAYAPDVETGEIARQIGSLLDSLDPAVVITHGSGGEYWHPAHLLVHAAVFQAVGGRENPSRTVLTFHAWQPDHALPGLLNRDDPPDLIVDGLPQRDARLASLRCHRSQFGLFSRWGGGTVEGFIDRTSTEGYRIYPAPLSGPDRAPAPSSVSAGFR